MLTPRLALSHVISKAKFHNHMQTTDTPSSRTHPSTRRTQLLNSISISLLSNPQPMHTSLPPPQSRPSPPTLPFSSALYDLPCDRSDAPGAVLVFPKVRIRQAAGRTKRGSGRTCGRGTRTGAQVPRARPRCQVRLCVWKVVFGA